MKNFNLEAIQDLWERSLTAKTISVPLESVSQKDTVENAQSIGKKKHFDVVGIKDDGGTIGYIDIKKADKETCGENYLQFKIQDLVSLETPLKDCLIKIQSKERLFVLDNKGVNQIITLADLHKQPVRMLLFSLISLIEMSMSVLVTKDFPNDEWQGKISEDRLESAKNIFDDRKRKNQECNLIDCLQISDKSTILLKNEYAEKWGFDTKPNAKSFFKNLNKLRDNLAHSQQTVWEDITELISIHSKAEKVLEINVELLNKIDVGREG